MGWWVYIQEILPHSLVWNIPGGCCILSVGTRPARSRCSANPSAAGRAGDSTECLPVPGAEQGLRWTWEELSLSLSPEKQVWPQTELAEAWTLLVTEQIAILLLMSSSSLLGSIGEPPGAHVPAWQSRPGVLSRSGVYLGAQLCLLKLR